MTDNCAVQENCWIDVNKIPNDVFFSDDEDFNGSGGWFKFLGAENYQNYGDYSFNIIENNSGISIGKVTGSQFVVSGDFQYLNTGESKDFSFKFAVYDKFGSYIKDVTAHVNIRGITDTTTPGENDGPLKAYDVFINTDDAGNHGNAVAIKYDGKIDGYWISNDGGHGIWSHPSYPIYTGGVVKAVGVDLTQFDYLQAGQQVQFVGQYTIQRYNPSTQNFENSTANIYVTVRGWNDTPEANDDFTSLNQGAVLTYDVLANDTDKDNAHSELTIQKISQIKIGDQVFSDSSTISKYVSIVNNKVVFDSSKVDMGGKTSINFEVCYRITDNTTPEANGQSSSSTDEAILHITVNKSPVVVNPFNVTDNEDGTLPSNTGDTQQISFKLDVENPNSQSLIYKIFGNGVVDKGNGNYQITKDGHTYDFKLGADGIITFDKSQFQWMNTDTPNIVFDFQYGVSTGSSQTHTVTVADALTGNGNGQNWGSIKLKMWNLDGTLIEATKYNNAGLGETGIGNDWGRIGEIEYDPATGRSEKTELDFGQTVTNAKVTLGLFWKEFPDNVEVATWKAYDANGNLVGEGRLDATVFIDSGNKGVGIIDINIPGGFTKIVLGELPYNNSGNNNGFGNGDSSDYIITQVQYTTAQQWVNNNGTITITGLNDNPVDGDENYNITTQANPNTFAMNLLDNATDIDDTKAQLSIKSINKVVIDGVEYTDAATISKYVSNTGAQAILNTNQIVVDANSTKVVKIYYTVKDSHGGSDDSVATINLQNTNKPPVVKAVDQTDNEDGTLPANTGDTSKITFKLDATDPDGDAITYKLSGNGVTDLTNGNYAVSKDGRFYDVKVDANGTVTFDKTQFQWMSPDSAPLVFNFNYTVTDSKGAAVTTTAKFTILGLNDNPVDGNEDLGTIAHNAANQTINILANSSDIDAGDVVSVKSIDSIVFNGQTITGANIANYITVDALGIATIKPGAFNVPSASTYNVIINYTVTDKFGGTDTSTLKFNVNNSNNPPVVNPLDLTDNEDGTLPSNTGDTSNITFKLTATDADGDRLTYKLTGNGLVVVNTLVDDGYDHFSINVGGRDYAIKVAKDGTGTVVFDKAQFQWMSPDTTPIVFNLGYTVTDAKGASASTTAKFTILGLNDAPVDGDEYIGNISTKAPDQVVNLIANSSDIDQGDVVKVKSIDSIIFDGKTITGADILKYVTVDANGVATIKPGAFEVPPSKAFDIVINYTVTDKFGGTDTSKLFVTFQNPDVPNNPPVVNPLNLTDNEDGTLPSNTNDGSNITFKVLGTDQDGDVLKYSLNAPNTTLVNGTTTGNSTLYFYKVTVDGKTYDFTFNDTTGVISFDKSQFQWMNTDTPNIVFNWAYTATDGKGGSATAPVKLTITGLNDNPVDGDETYSVSTQSFPNNYVLNLLDNATDIDDTKAQLSIKSINKITIDGVEYTDAATINKYVYNAGGQAILNTDQFTIPADSTKVIKIYYTVKDSHGGSDDSVVTVNLQNNNKPPVLTAVNETDNEDGTLPANANDTTQIKFQLKATDPDGDAISYKIAGNGVVDNGSGNYKVTLDGRTYDVKIGNDGSVLFDKTQFQWMNIDTPNQVFNFTYTVTDSKGAASSTTAKFTITGLNDNPIANPDSYQFEEGTGWKVINLLANDKDDVDDASSTLKVTSIGKILVDGQEIPTSEYSQYVRISADGKTVEYNTDKFDVANGTSKPVVITYNITDPHGGTSSSTASITISDDDHCPVVTPINLTDNEDGTLPSNTGDTGQISFKLDAVDADGDALVYKIFGNGVVDKGNGNYQIAKDGKTYDVKLGADGVLTFDKSQFQWMNTDTPNIVFNFGFGAKEVGSTTEVKITDPLTGTAGNQVWGGVNIKMLDTNGNPILAKFYNDPGLGETGLGNENGRIGEIEYDPNTGKFETTELSFNENVTNAQIKLGLFWKEFGGNTEVATWKAYDANGNLVGEGRIDATVILGSGQPGVGTIDINIPGGFTKVVLGGLPYNADPNNGNFSDWTDSTDYIITGITYTSDCGWKETTGTITITGVNDNPVAVADVFTIQETDTAPAPTADWKFIDALANDYDNVDDTHASLKVTGFSNVKVNGVDVPAGDFAKFFRVVDGKLEFNANVIELNKGQSATITYNYTIVDGHGGPASSTGTINLVGNNNPPVVNPITDTDNEDGTLATQANDPTQISFKLVATDPEGDAISYKVAGNGVVDLGGNQYQVTQGGRTYDFTIAANGTVLFNKAQFQWMNTDTPNVVFNFNYTATDSNGASSTSTAKFTITGLNDNPTAVADTFTIDETDTAVAPTGDWKFIDALANDYDNIDDTHASLKVTGFSNVKVNGVDVPAGDFAKFFRVVDGKLEFNANVLELKDGETATITYNYSIVDGHGGPSSSTGTVNLVGHSNPPVDQDVTYTEDEDATGGVSNLPGEVAKLTFKFDTISPSGNALEFTAPDTITVNGQTIRLVNNGNGTFTLNESDVKTKLNSMYEGQTVLAQFNYVTKDLITGVTINSVAKISFNGINDAPTANDDTASVKESETVTIDVLANDTDPDTQDPSNPLYITKVSKIVIDGQTITDASIIANYIKYLDTTALGSKKITFTAPELGLKEGEFKDIQITYIARDKQGLTDEAVVTVRINGTNDDKIDIALDSDNVKYDVITNNSVANNIFNSTSKMVVGEDVTFKNDTYVGKPGDDKIIGDIRNFNVNVTAGDATSLVKNSISGNAHAQTDATFTGNKFTFGNDNIDGGTGNDLIIGDVDNLSFKVDQGNAKAEIDYATCGGNPTAYASANALFTNNTFKFGGDTLKGGEGNDKLIGDVAKFDASYLAGTREEILTGQGSVTNYKEYGFTGNTFTFGNDTLEGGNGDDVLVGDVEHFKYTEILNKYVTNASGQVTFDSTTSTTIEFDANDTAKFAEFKASKFFANSSFTFGADTFVFNASTAFGNDKILDFKINNEADKIKFVSLLDANNNGSVNFDDLKLLTKVVNDGSGHVKLLVDTNKDGNFDSSITFLNKTFNAADTTVDKYFDSSDFII